MRAGCWHWTCESPSRLPRAFWAGTRLSISKRKQQGKTPVQQENVGLKLLEAKLIPPDALQKARKARARMEQLLVD